MTFLGTRREPQRARRVGRVSQRSSVHRSCNPCAVVNPVQQRRRPPRSSGSTLTETRCISRSTLSCRASVCGQALVQNLVVVICYIGGMDAPSGDTVRTVAEQLAMVGSLSPTSVARLAKLWCSIYGVIPPDFAGSPPSGGHTAAINSSGSCSAFWRAKRSSNSSSWAARRFC